jgi:DNA polymerase bacteriophage-type
VGEDHTYSTECQSSAANRVSSGDHILFRDYETRSTLDLKCVGAWRYAADPTTDVWCAAYAVDDDPVKLWVPGDPVPPEFIEAANNPDWIVSAFNDHFERVVEKLILAPRYGWPLAPIERHRCSQAAALALALPAKLETVADVLALEHRKDKDGGRLMRQMSKPRKPRKDEDPAGIYWLDDAERLARLYEYNKQDVATERALHRRIGGLIPSEQELWALDAQINERGIYIDRELLAAAIKIADEAQAAIAAELQAVTCGVVSSVHEVANITMWLAAHDCEVKDVQKETLRRALTRKNLAPEARRVIELRLEGAHAAAAKFETMRDWIDGDGRARGLFRYHGASTGRWTSHGIQLQNMKRPLVDDMDAAIAAVGAGSLAHMRERYPQPMSVVGDVARAMICAAPGHRLIAADLSGIESRVTAWVSEQQSKLDLWANFDRTKDPADDPYYVLGKALGIADEQARSVGKTADLAFGYMGGKGAWEKLAPADDASTEDEIKQRQQAWRREHPNTVRFWHRVTDAARRAVRKPGKRYDCGRVALQCDGTFLRMELPSGRSLAYPHPELKAAKYGDVTVSFMDNAGGKWVPCRYGQGAYGGTWIENAVQAIARDLFAAAMIRLEAAGYPIVLHVHDEIVAEVPDGRGSPEEFLSILTAAPDWAPGLPLAAKVRNGPRFCKTSAKLASPAPPIAEDTPVHDDSPSLQPDAVPPWEDAPEPAQASGNSKDAPRARKAKHYAYWDEDDGGEAYDAPEPEPKVSRRKADNGGRHAFAGYQSGERETGSAVEAYVYRDAGGHEHTKVVRTSTKQFPQYHKEGGKWVSGKPAGPKLPYRLPELIAADPEEEVYVAEGEACADAVAALGLLATTNSEGAGKWTADLDCWFIGKKRVYVCEDNDEPGRAHAAEVVEHMRAIGVKDIRVLSFPELDEKDDVKDWLAQGYTKADLLARAQEAPAAPSLSLGVWDAGDDVEPPPPRGWLLGTAFARGFVSSLYAPGGSGKTAVRYTQYLALATGKPLTGEYVHHRGRVLIVSLEDDDKELQRRIRAARMHHKIGLDEVKGWLFQAAPGLRAGKLVELDDKGRTRRGTLARLIGEAIERHKPDLVALDPFVKTHGLEENNNAHMDAVVGLLTEFAAEYDVAIDVPHHTRKGPVDPGNADSGRGASAQRDAGRLVYTLTPMSAEEGKAFGVDEEQRREFVRMDGAKVNIAPKWKAKWFRLVSVQLDNATDAYPSGDHVQAIEPWTPPDVWQDVGGDALKRILDRIDAGMPDGERYSAAPNAKARAAWQVVVEVLPSKTEGQAREVIKTWVKNGVLESYEYDSPKERKTVAGLRVKVEGGAE